MTVPISESNPKIQCQYVLLKAEFFLKKTKEIKIKIKINKTNRKQNQRKKIFFSPHTPHFIHALSSMYSICIKCKEKVWRVLTSLRLKVWGRSQVHPIHHLIHHILIFIKYPKTMSINFESTVWNFVLDLHCSIRKYFCNNKWPFLFGA